MRHVNSVLLSLILAPAVWALAGYGLVAYGRAANRPDGDLAVDRLVGLGALAAAAILFAALLLPRLSPLGPALAGLAYLGAAAWVAGYPALTRQSLGRLPLELGGDLIRPAEGLAVLLGLPLLTTVLSGRRWRRFDGAPALYDPPSPADDGSAPTQTVDCPPGPTAAYPPTPAGLSAPVPAVATTNPWRPPPGWTPPPGAGPAGPAVAEVPPPWPPWRFGPPGGAGRSGSGRAYGRPADPFRDADTADLTRALQPLRRAVPPA
ncbi:hypothetical protein ACFFWC_29575 [Plantactinospora siamensis]|uniref:Uncharacterized protein n=1 Tax=Plantactinospora siamensis TaxID=555372 RepID=A0ABV6NPG8_9ACTN